MKAMVSMRDVSKSYGDFTALHPTNLEIAEGEFLTLLGPSGSGKTTLLNVIAGSAEVSTGSIQIQGRDVTNVPSRKRDLGMVFQNYALFPHMTVRQNIGFPLTLRKRRADEVNREVDRVLELVSLPHVAERKPKELSGGQQQRIAIARSLVYSPKLILMDEPLGALDRKLRESLQYEIKLLHEDLKMTVLYVTHDQEEALMMSDRICLMKDGRIEQLGAPKDMYFKPATRFAAEFLGISNVTTAKVGPAETLQFADGFNVTGDIKHSAAPGETVSVTVRPESVTLAPEGDGSTSGVKAVIEDVVFLGSVTHLMLRTHQGEPFIVKILTSRTDQSFPVGAAVRLSFSAMDVVPIK